VIDPGTPTNELVTSVGSVAGWLALAPAAVGVVWLARVRPPRWASHALPLAGLMAGVLAACTASGWDPGRTWLGEHVLTFAWLSTGGGLLAAAWVASLRPPGEVGEAPPWWTPLVSRTATVGWPTASRHCWGRWRSPAAGPTLIGRTGRAPVALASGGLTGTLALWTRRGGFVYASGLLVNVAGHLAWLAWSETAGVTAGSVAERLVLTHVACLALASLAWSLIELGGRRVLRLPKLTERVPPFRHLAAWAALGLLAATVGFRLLADAAATALPPQDPAVWFVLLALLAAAAATLWDGPEQRWRRPGRSCTRWAC